MSGIAGKQQDKGRSDNGYVEPDISNMMVADPILERMTESQIRKSIDATTAKMKEAAKNLDFLQAAQYRDEIIRLQTLLK